MCFKKTCCSLFKRKFCISISNYEVGGTLEYTRVVEINTHDILMGHGTKNVPYGQFLKFYEKKLRKMINLKKRATRRQLGDISASWRQIWQHLAIEQPSPHLW